MRVAIEKYEEWVANLKNTEETGDHLVERLVALLDHYKTSIELDLVFDSSENFLYRQKGQLKLDNTVLEEFLPWLVGRVLDDRLSGRDLVLGPTNAFSQLRFDSDLRNAIAGGGMAVRSKNHDFALARPLFLKASHKEDFSESREESTHLAYLAAEIKTNLDKTMFQEAAATAFDLKRALPNSQYFLLCEWLDMTPISTAVTSIEEVIVLRKAKRLPANVRSHFSTSADRSKYREVFASHLRQHPFATAPFERFLSHVRRLLGDDEENEDDALSRGWF